MSVCLAVSQSVCLSVIQSINQSRSQLASQSLTDSFIRRLSQSNNQSTRDFSLLNYLLLKRVFSIHAPHISQGPIGLSGANGLPGIKGDMVRFRSSI